MTQYHYRSLQFLLIHIDYYGRVRQRQVPAQTCSQLTNCCFQNSADRVSIQAPAPQQ